MVDNNQNIGDSFARGFLVKDKSGKLKKVTDGKISEYKPAQKEQTADVPKPVSSPPPVPKRNAPPAPPPSPSAPPPPPAPKSPPPQPATFQPAPPISESRIAPVQMDPDDELEIKQHAKALDQMVAKSPVDSSFAANNVIEKIIREQGLQFENEILLVRFTKVLESQLREIRTPIETKELLMRPVKVGGLELPDDQADTIVKNVDKELKGLHQTGYLQEKQKESEAEKESTESGTKGESGGSMLPAPPPAFVPRPGEGKKPEPPRVKEDKPQPVLPHEDIVKPVAEPQKQDLKPEPASIVEKQDQIQQPSLVEELKPTEPAPPVEPAPVSPEATAVYGTSSTDMPRRVRVTEDKTDRPKMVDIKQPMAVVGPVDELGALDLKEFRRMGASPQEAADKVLEMIELLEEDSWKIRMDGIEAWKRSRLHMLYVEIGRESIETNTGIDEVISKRTSESRPFMLLDEFFAINSLNSSITI